MTRQYVGARYVPKFFENAQGGTDWTSGVIYEPLTIVTYNGNSYTSKKTVPATVGNPSANPEYWAATGLYNTQVEELRQQVEEYAADVEDYAADLQENIQLTNRINLRGRNFILIGDSYAAGVNPDEERQGGWAKRFHDYCAGWANVYYNILPLGGVYGFASSRPYIDVIRSLESEIDDPESITDIAVFGGTNDLGLANQVPAAIATFMAYCHSQYPNATVRVGCLGRYINRMRSELEPAYRRVCEYGGVYVSDTLNLICNKTYIASDGVHLLNAGYAYYSPYIANAIIDGHCQYRQSAACPVTSEDGFSGNITIRETVTEAGYSLSFRSQGQTAQAVTIPEMYGSGQTVKIGTCELGLYLPRYSDQMGTADLVLLKNDNGFYTASYTSKAGLYVTEAGELYMLTGTKAVPTPSDITGLFPRMFINPVDNFMISE